MANTYFQVNNDSNQIQIDDNYKQYSLAGVFVLANHLVGSGAVAGDGYQYYIEDLFILPALPSNYLYVIKENGTELNEIFFQQQVINGQLYFCCRRDNRIMPNTTYANTIKIYVFAPQKAGTENYGLEIFNENGEQVFHSSNYPLKILSFNIGYPNAESFANGEVMFSAPWTYGCSKGLVLTQAFHWYGNPYSMFVYRNLCLNFTGDTMQFLTRVAPLSFTTGYVGDKYFTDINFSRNIYASFMVVDLTNCPL